MEVRYLEINSSELHLECFNYPQEYIYLATSYGKPLITLIKVVICSGLSVRKITVAAEERDQQVGGEMKGQVPVAKGVKPRHCDIVAM